MLELKVAGDDDIEEVRHLFREYADSLGIKLDFQNFEAELARLPGDYCAPKGCILIALLDGQTVGCVALREFGERVCEMKRLYVRPKFQGLKIGRALAESIIEMAKTLRYRKMRLDTLPSMKSAHSLYASLGFREIPPYRYNPVQGTSFMELTLTEPGLFARAVRKTDDPVQN